MMEGRVNIRRPNGWLALAMAVAMFAVGVLAVGPGLRPAR